MVHFKVEKILNLAWIWSHHLHLQWNFKLWAGKFAWGVKAKHWWVLSTNFWKQKNCWHHPAMFCLITSSKLTRQFEFSQKVTVMGSNPNYLLKFFYFTYQHFTKSCCRERWCSRISRCCSRNERCSSILALCCSIFSSIFEFCWSIFSSIFELCCSSCCCSSVTYFHYNVQYFHLGFVFKGNF